METVSENRSFGGVQGVYSHQSHSCRCEMTFGLFLPDESRFGPVPVLWYLSGLTCTHENAMVKAGAQQWAAEQGIALVFPDTSPRGEDVADDPGYDLGKGAGFYVNATQEPWAKHYQMWDYVTEDLPSMLQEEFPLDMSRQSIMGHSMGGHGALTMAMALPGRYRSVSALAPICNPTGAEWGKKQLRAYLGTDESAWAGHDASVMMREKGFDGPVLIDTGTDDQFIDMLRPETLANAAAARRQDIQFRLQKGYDHSYFFVSSFMEDHVAFHAEALYAD
ncbi:S-formylglutathione hydrolase [Shimia biformata]|uniref:S-formylglutathione hydrolase n=1 Tax=Shimia biformata TaxID=1294299 RepID=UPI00194E3214|nr:S-formylglutathione hydrolase [Shimia biformata]